MAEAHPVGFQWVMEAKERGAKVIHVDPRFTRTSAHADQFVPIRVGTDIAFLGGIINYVLPERARLPRVRRGVHQRPRRSSASDFRDTEDLDGLFSGFDPETRTYDTESWQYDTQEDRTAAEREDQPMQRETASGLQHETHGTSVDGRVRRDETLQHPQCVYQVLKRHYARYTPEMVAETCGVSRGGLPRGLQGVDRATPTASGRPRWSTASAGPSTASACSTSAPARSSSCCWATWAVPAAGSWRCAATPASRGRPTSRRCSTSCRATSRCRTPRSTPALEQWVDAIRKPGIEGVLGQRRAYEVSLLKAYWGDAATAENDFCFDYLPKITGDHGTYRTVLDMIDGKVKGYFLLGQNPAVGSAHGKAQRLGMANLDWLVVRDLFEIESATFWKDSPEIETGEIVPEECRTEVFLMPAASHVEKEGTFTQTQRMLQWREKALDAGRRLPLRAVVLLPPGPDGPGAAGGLHRGAGPPGPRPRLGLPAARRARRAARRGRAQGDQRLRGRHRPPAVDVHGDEGRRLHRRWAAGSTPASTRTASTRPPAASRAGSSPGWPRSGAGRGRRTGGCSTTAPRPTPRASRGASGRPTSGGTTGRPASGPGHDVPDFEKNKPPSYRPPEGADGVEGIAGDDPFIMQGDGKGCALRAAGAHRRADADALRAGRVAVPQPALRPAEQPDPQGVRPRDNRMNPSPPERAQRGLPRRLHDEPADRAPHGRRDEPLRAVPRRAAAGDVRRGLAAARRRARARAQRLVPRHHRPCRDRGTGARHRPAAAAAGRGPHRAPGVAALPLGSGRARHRRLGQRPDRASRWTPTCSSRRARSAPATCVPGGARQGQALLDLVAGYRGRDLEHSTSRTSSPTARASSLRTPEPASTERAELTC